MKTSIKHLFHINAPKQKVFEAVSTIKGLSNWWTVKTNGDDTLGGRIQFDFGDTIGPEMKIIEYKPDSSIIWKCVASSHGWLGHRFMFLFDTNNEKTRVRFSHEGWDKQDDFYAICSFSWGRYLESLRQYCETGKGQAFGSNSNI